jgi:hypothetical protein
LEIFWLEKRVLGEQLENAADGDPHPPNARLPAHFRILGQVNSLTETLRCSVRSTSAYTDNSILMALPFVLELTGESGV